MSGYDASSIVVLEGLQAVRKRPGMYIGAGDSRGAHHLLWEIIDNAVDEALAGHADRIEVTIGADGTCTVSDNGRGVPVGPHPSGLDALEVVFCRLHAGGKFGGSGYGATGGLHGVGAAVVNALSEHLEVEVVRDGTRWAAAWQRGEPVRPGPKGGWVPAREGEVVRRLGRTRRSQRGTTVRFRHDRDLFTDVTIDTARVLERLEPVAWLVDGLRFVVVDERDRTRVELSGGRGLTGYVERLAGAQLVGPVLEVSGEGTYTETVPVHTADGTVRMQELERCCRVRVAVGWTTGEDTVLRASVNTVPTPGGGTHVTGFERALVRVLNEVLRDQRILRSSEENITGDDAREGMVAVVDVNIPEPRFEAQTKEVLGTPGVTGVVYRVVADGLRELFGSPRGKRARRAVLVRVAEAMRSRVAAREARELRRQRQRLGQSSLPAKLADCRRRGPEGTELIIVEGDSAMGSARAGRDASFQALLPLRGKLLNAARASERSVLANAECAAVIAALGGGVGRSFSLDDVRYERVILLCDADVDGAHIRCLLLTLLWRTMRPLITGGRVFAAVPPLYRVLGRDGRSMYAYSDRERDLLIARAGGPGRIREVRRYKGLGEMDADELAETTLDPATRRLRRITVADARAAERVVELFMGRDVGPRRDAVLSGIDTEAVAELV